MNVDVRPLRTVWVGYAACAWALQFATPHLYWAVGGRVGLGFALAWRGDDEEALIRDPWFIAFGLWGVAAASILAASVALALVRPWGRMFPRRALLTAAWGVCTVMVLRALVYPGFIFSGLRVLGVLRSSASADPAWVRWDLLLFSPWFAVGGLLFGLAAWRYGRASPATCDGMAARTSRLDSEGGRTLPDGCEDSFSGGQRRPAVR